MAGWIVVEIDLAWLFGVRDESKRKENMRVRKIRMSSEFAAKKFASELESSKVSNFSDFFFVETFLNLTRHNKKK